MQNANTFAHIIIFVYFCAKFGTEARKMNIYYESNGFPDIERTGL